MKDKILYADDQDGLRTFYKAVFDSYLPEFETEPFADGSSLERRLEKSLEGVKVIFTDNEMPGIKGSEIIKTHARRGKFKDIKFILYYGGDQSIGENLVKNHGAFAYLQKPAKPEDIVEIIKKALNSTKLSQ